MKKVFICLLYFVIIVSMVGCKSQNLEENTEKPLDVYCVKPKIGTLERYTSIVGKTVPQTSSDVVTQLSEKVIKVYKKVGDHVKKGELLLELDSKDIDRELESSKADFELSKANVEKMVGSTIDSTVDNAQSGYERLKNSIKVMEANLDVLETKGRSLNSQIRNVDKHIKDIEEQIATNPELKDKLDNLKSQKSELESAKDQMDKSYDNLLTSYEDNKDNLEEQKKIGGDIVDVTTNQMKDALTKTANAILTVSEITYNNALKKLDDTKIYSPIDGYVDFCNVKENNTFASGNVAFTISERQNTLIEFSVSGIHVSSLSLGNKITFTNRADDFTATITEIPPMVDTSTGLFKITASVDNKNQNFVFGANHFVKIPTEHASNAMTVPMSCVYFENKNVYVYIAKDGISIKTPVETGIYNDKDIEIKSGIEKSDDVIISWSSNLIDGAKINIKHPEENTSSPITESEE